MKLLVIKLRDLGDTAIWTASLNALRQNYPIAKIHALTLASSRALLEGHSAVDALHTVRTASPYHLLPLLCALRKERFDLALGFHATSSLCRFAFLLGAKEIVLHHHSRHTTPRFSTHSIAKPGFLQDAISRDFEVLKAIGLEPDSRRTELQVTKTEQAAALQAIATASRIRVALLPGARAETRRYPRDLWLTVLDRLCANPSLEPVVLADPEISRNWNLRQECDARGVLLRDRMSLREFLAAISVCQFALGNDSGPIHMAVALGLPTLTLFGPGCVGDWHPYSKDRHGVLRTPVDCRLEGPRDQPEFQYCTVKACSHLSCLRGISSDRVADEVARRVLRV